jgi:hypothetical protein
MILAIRLLCIIRRVASLKYRQAWKEDENPLPSGCEPVQEYGTENRELQLSTQTLPGAQHLWLIGELCLSAPSTIIVCKMPHRRVRWTHSLNRVYGPFVRERYLQLGIES